MPCGLLVVAFCADHTESPDRRNQQLRKDLSRFGVSDDRAVLATPPSILIEKRVPPSWRPEQAAGRRSAHISAGQVPAGFWSGPRAVDRARCARTRGLPGCACGRVEHRAA